MARMNEEHRITAEVRRNPVQMTAREFGKLYDKLHRTGANA